MTISQSVYNQLFDQSNSSRQERVIRLGPTETKNGVPITNSKTKAQTWTPEEHDRFLAALEAFPSGPWKRISDWIGTKTARQTMTHAQKYRQKIHRRQRGLRNRRKQVAQDDVYNNGNNSPMDSPSSPITMSSGLDVLVHSATTLGATQIQPMTQPHSMTFSIPPIKKIHSPSNHHLSPIQNTRSNVPYTTGKLPPTISANHLPPLAEILHLSGTKSSKASSQYINRNESGRTYISDSWGATSCDGQLRASGQDFLPQTWQATRSAV
jgi:SHAQKYF class myb-like DNA-binding protein